MPPQKILFACACIVVCLIVYFLVTQQAEKRTEPMTPESSQSEHKVLVPPQPPGPPSFKDFFAKTHPHLTEAQVDAYIQDRDVLNARIAKRREELLGKQAPLNADSVFLIESQLRAEFEKEVRALDDAYAIKAVIPEPVLGAPTR